ncbi:ShlB/FhaC/HecB family hemolysin secretion/activation protein [uncultured Spongiibacter sp.]|uniref:ShlB/FhaC/HecB family hemolysin secretion/activation protein n=1 Tax=Spongiibacter marinus TaxID=354246 RepID=UPI00258E5E4C|nr:ShlB/FhaC/HecB family hemolysin secretion/activation protein [uncultured Spongiibacter sp.]
MAIDLPPVMPPVNADVAQVQAAKNASATVIEADVNGTTVRVYGNEYLSDSELRDLLASAKTPAEAVIGLAKRYYQDGHLLMKVDYARMLDSVAILVKQLRLNDVTGAEEIRPYFADLAGDADLSIAEFHRAKVLADLRSRRAGYDYDISYVEQGDDAVDIQLSRTAIENYDATEIIVEANNKGSRFLGRYFGLAGVKHKFESGTQASVSYQTAFTDLGESRDGEELNQVSISVDHPFAHGLYGIEVNYVDYLREPTVNQTNPGSCVLGPLFCTPGTTSSTGVELDAEILQATLRGEQVLYSTPWQQFSLTERIEFIDSTIDQEGRSEKLLDENYQVVELGGRYTLNRFQSEEQNAARLNASLKLRAGFGDGGTLDRYDEYRAAYQQQNPGQPVPDIVAPARTAEFIALLPSLSYEQRITDGVTMKTTARGQFADEQLPQQQQFVLGGMDSMSAYLPGVLIGDEGYHLKVSLNKAIKAAEGLKLTPSLFAEYGGSWYNNTNSDFGDEQALADAGLRLKLEYGDFLYSELVAAKSIYDDVVNDDFIEELEADFYWRLRLTF